MNWKINFTSSAEKEFSKLTKSIKLSIRNYLKEKVIHNPRDYGNPLATVGKVKLWRYRIADYRLICRLDDIEITVLVVKIGKRDSIYKDKS